MFDAQTWYSGIPCRLSSRLLCSGSLRLPFGGDPWLILWICGRYFAGLYRLVPIDLSACSATLHTELKFSNLGIERKSFFLRFRVALKILVADDHPVVRQGICSLLKSQSAWEISGEALDGRQAVQMTRELRPDIVILDLAMPTLNGLDATRQILDENPDQKVLILTMSDSEQLIREVLGAGARGFVLKSDAAKDLISAVQALERHRTFFTSRVQDILDSYFAPSSLATLPTLTNREREVLQLIAEGKTTKEVAVILGCSVKTAETHRSNFMRKLHLHSVSEVVLYAIRNQIIRVDQLAT